MNFDRPNIFIAGSSGTGKTSSLRNLDPDKTIILNTERKQLPFRHASKFKKKMDIDSFSMFDACLDKAIQADGCEVIVIESFTSLVEIVKSETVGSQAETGDPWPWQTYYDMLHSTLNKCKRRDRYVVFIGIDETKYDDQMRRFKQIDVQGQLRGKVEKEFEMVLWTKVINGDYCFATNNDGIGLAKTPMGMFEDLYIPNDLNAVLTQIENYYTGVIDE